jgi:hypothetical protein
MNQIDSLFDDDSISDDPVEFRQLIDKAVAHMQALTESHDNLWQIGEADWEVDLDTGIITFDSPNGLRATAPVQIIGTYNTGDETWLWGWDHPSVSPPIDQHALQILQYGKQHEIPDLTTRKLFCAEDRCWEFTAVACFLSKAQGAYRGDAGSTLVFMTFGDVKLSNAK